MRNAWKYLRQFRSSDRTCLWLSVTLQTHTDIKIWGGLEVWSTFNDVKIPKDTKKTNPVKWKSDGCKGLVFKCGFYRNKYITCKSNVQHFWLWIDFWNSKWINKSWKSSKIHRKSWLLILKNEWKISMFDLNFLYWNKKGLNYEWSEKK